MLYEDILVQAVRKHPGNPDTLGIKNHGIKILRDRIGGGDLSLIQTKRRL
jgi:hypothetical protein